MRFRESKSNKSNKSKCNGSQYAIEKYHDFTNWSRPEQSIDIYYYQHRICRVCELIESKVVTIAGNPDKIKAELVDNEGS